MEGGGGGGASMFLYILCLHVTAFAVFVPSRREHISLADLR
jgi:hypothetical protein